MQTRTDRTAALGAIGLPAKDAWFDSRTQIGGIVGRQSREHTIIGRAWWLLNGASDARIHEQLVISGLQSCECLSDLLPLRSRQNLRRMLILLGRVQARPYA